jgi:hypothetical protein
MINYKLQDFKTEGIDLEAFNTAPVEEDPKMLIWDFCILIS